MRNRFLVCISFLWLAANAWGQAPQRAPERPLQDFLSSLSREDMRSLMNSRDPKEHAEITIALSKVLESKEVGKKWTLKFTSSGETTSGLQDNRTSLRGDSNKSVVRANGIPVYVCVIAEVDQSMVDKIKDSRAGRKMYATGTIKDLSIGYGRPLIGVYKGSGVTGASRMSLTITVTADDVGPDK